MDALKRFITTNRLSVYTVVAVFSGLVLGLLVRAVVWPDGNIDAQLLRFISLPGVIYIRLFLLLIVPLLITSLATSFFTRSEEPQVNLDPSSDEIDPRHDVVDPVEPPDQISPGRLFITTFVVFIAFSLVCALLGCALVQLVQPGRMGSQVVTKSQGTLPKNVTLERMDAFEQWIYQADMVYNIVLNIFPENPLTPMFMMSHTKSSIEWPHDGSILQANATLKPNMITSTHQTFKTNMLGLCVLSLCLGLILHQLGPEKTKTYRMLLTESDDIVRCIMRALMKIMPFGIFCWMFSESLKMKSLGDMAIKLAYLYMIFFLALSVIWFIFYPVVYGIFTRKNAFMLYGQIFPAIIVAFGSGASAVALPEMMRCMETNVKLPKRVLQTVLPLGMTINMNGSAMYYPMVALFVAQVKDVPVGLFSIVVMSLFSVMMSMGFAPTSMGGALLINHLTFASVLGVENAQEVLTYIVAMEWMMERVRTVTNVVGDAIAAGCIDRLVKGQPKKLSK